MGSGKYILDDNGNPVFCDNVIKWADWYECNRDQRVVEKTNLSDGVKVSTIFLGLDHNSEDGPPVLWETVIFGGMHDQKQWRYFTRDEAIQGHTNAIQLVQSEIVPM